jgi:transposase
LAQQGQLKAAIQAAPAAAGIGLANWNWKVVRQFVQERFGRVLSRSSCNNYLHRLGFVLKRPKKRLLKANAEKREAFVAAYVALRDEARLSGAKIFFVDEAHFRADVEVRAKWVLRGQPALVDTSSPRFGEKATYYSAVCLETGEVEAMPVVGNTNAASSVAFLQQLRAKHAEPLVVIWDNGPAHHGPEIRVYLTTPQLQLRLVALPGYSPDFNPDEAIWDWIREDVTANTCFDTAAKVREKVDAFFAELSERAAEVQRRCRRELQAQADALVDVANQLFTCTKHVDFTLVPV